MDKLSTIDEYIAQYPGDVQTILQSIRQTIRKAAPDATERMSWNMPTFWQNKNLIHFAAAKKHIGIYPGGDVVEYFTNKTNKLSGYKTSKGTIQLPLDKPIPHELITEIIKFKLQSIAEK